jgi:hypothetical protein
MKKSAFPKKTIGSIAPPWLMLKKKEKKGFLASAGQLEEQCDRLGLLDPTEMEPAVIFGAREDRK